MGAELDLLQAFDQCDVDNNGRIDIKELHIGLLILYDKINQLLPIHYPLPRKWEVRCYRLCLVSPTTMVKRPMCTAELQTCLYFASTDRPK